MNEYKEPVSFINLAKQQEKINKEINAGISNVLSHGQYIMGPEVKELETKLSEYTKSKHVLSCANGTDALTLALMSWNIKQGDAVFVPSFTYVASAESPAQLGATPFFVDVDKSTFNIDHNSFKQAVYDARQMGLKPSVVIVVDLFGRPADIKKIKEIARNEKIKILIDAAQSFGGKYNNNRVGSMGDITTTSFFPAKPLGCYGDGGAIFTSNDKTAELIDSMRLHGKGSEKYDNVRIGLNSRLDTIQAAILIEKFKIFPNELILRNRIADRYNSFLDERLTKPYIPRNISSAWAQYTVRTENRDVIQSELKKKKIPSIIYYPIPLSKQDGYKHFPSVKSGTPNSENLSETVLSFPMHPYLEENEQDKIIETINNVIKKL